uniref:Frag1/DRAM/Sfk1 family protein n=1 Tax=Candidatus Kentrum sp. FW TaxID=2126338 RepID=A0A450TYV3_9GAMM|nr:MAG: hypothetical protein BECKFW1821C_GA0114237_106819 [Candidatus Kentron sp. FW]
MQKNAYTIGAVTAACPLLIFLFGVTTLFATMIAFLVLEPDFFTKEFPNISRVSIRGTGYFILVTGMSVTGICILRSVHLVVTLHTHAISRFAHGAAQRRRWRLQNHLPWVFSAVAALSFAGRSIPVSGSMHVWFSLVFLVAQGLLILTDALLVIAIGRNAAGRYPLATGTWMRIRGGIAGVLFVFGIIMLILYYGQAYLPGWLVPRAYSLYAIFLWLYAFLSLGYCGAYFPDVLRVRRQPDWSR